MSKLQDLGLVPLIRNKIKNGATHKEVSNYIKRLFPMLKGASARSVRRLCENFDIHYSSRLSDQHLDIIVSWSVGKVLTI